MTRESMEDRLVARLKAIQPEEAAEALPLLVSALCEMTDAYQTTGHYSWGRQIFERLLSELPRK